MNKEMLKHGAAALAAALLIGALVLAVWFGPQLEPWSWGWGLLGLGLAGVAAAVAIGLGAGGRTPAWLALSGLAVVAWIGWRAYTSPVEEHGMADGLLLAGGLVGFVVVRALDGCGLGERVALWGIALLTVASLVLIVWQVYEPGYRPNFGQLMAGFPGGFFGGYSEGANFVTGCALVLAGHGFLGNGRKWERIILGGVGVLGVAALWWLKSRGGLAGGAVGMGVFMVLALIYAKRTGSRWFEKGVVGLPLLGIAVVGFLIWGWNLAQEARTGEADMAQLLDNALRLHFASIAVACAFSHLLLGGGSRSFSWECYQHWDVSAYGYPYRRPDMVHNEMLQMLTDYGLIGGVLALLVVGGLLVWAVVRLAVLDEGAALKSNGPWRVGGVAAVLGMLTQSNFSFLFHVFPLAVLLGCCLGWMCRSGGAQAARGPVWRYGLAVAVGLASLALLPFGVKAARVTQIAWPAVYGVERDSDAALARLERAVAILPDYRLLVRLAKGRHEAANREDPGTERWEEMLAKAARAFEAAYRVNPREPTPVVNLGNLASLRGEDEAAERYFADALRMQGGMEAVFWVNLMSARHFDRKGNRLYQQGDLAGAIQAMRQAVEAIERGAKEGPQGQAVRRERVAMHEALGVVLKLSGDRAGAFGVLRLAADNIGSRTVQYRLAKLLSEQAEERYLSRQPEEALYLFEQALQAYQQWGGVEVPGVSRVTIGEMHRHITGRIQFLKGARIEPKECEAFPQGAAD